MIIRRPKANELNKLIELHKQLEDQFEFPDLEFVCSLAVAELDGEIIGFGALQPIYECTLILNKEKPISTRFEAINKLKDFVEWELSNQGIKQYHAFVQDKKFFNFLKKRFGFKNTKGTALVKVING